MNTSSWADWISFSVIALYAVPLVRWIQTGGRSEELYPLAGMVGTVALNEAIKHGILGTDCPRPPKAANCNLWLNDGPQGGRPGMPSGHSAQVSFFVGYYLQTMDFTSPVARLLAPLLLLYAGLVFASRYAKECHTVSQITVGALLGGMMSRWVVRLNRA